MLLKQERSQELDKIEVRTPKTIKAELEVNQF